MILVKVVLEVVFIKVRRLSFSYFLFNPLNIRHGVHLLFLFLSFEEGLDNLLSFVGVLSTCDVNLLDASKTLHFILIPLRNGLFENLFHKNLILRFFRSLRNFMSLYILCSLLI